MLPQPFVTNLNNNATIPNGTHIVELGRSRRLNCSNNRTIGEGSPVLIRWTDDVNECLSLSMFCE